MKDAKLHRTRNASYIHVTRASHVTMLALCHALFMTILLIILLKVLKATITITLKALYRLQELILIINDFPWLIRRGRSTAGKKACY